MDHAGNHLSRVSAPEQHTWSYALMATGISERSVGQRLLPRRKRIVMLAVSSMARNSMTMSSGLKIGISD